MSTAVTLCDGRQVAGDSPEWRDESFLRWQHVMNLRGRALAQRREYLRELERSAGAELALRVTDDYAKDWEARKAAQANPTTTTESQP